MESTNQVAHELEGLTLDTGTTTHAASSTHISAIEVVHNASGSTTGTSINSTHSASDNTPHVANTTGSGATSTTTNNTHLAHLRRQDAYRVNTNKQANLTRAQAIALGHAPPRVANHRANLRNRLHYEQRLQAIRRAIHQVNHQVNRPTVNMLRQLEARQRAPVIQVVMTPEQRAAAVRAERERDFWRAVAEVGMTHLVGQRELDEWMAKYE
ncbi:hypothetical protein B0H65DRAFT_460656 [Neurospora tetraspora]|uniref:Uncharacterized protein n=1 Tax=Neurospora tetraspora TaxID=94610 RepID=A0AAE0MTU5_9PEZI|nr:hypothetical protein B0H65DRAFT_460656 [Neurospora tetraspora]